MVVACDVENTYITFGFYESRENQKMLRRYAFGARSERTADELALLLDYAMRRDGLSGKNVEGCIVGSVRAPLTETVCRVCETLFGKTPLQVGHGLRTGLAIRTDRQTELGADLVANAVAASAILTKPFAVCDFGTVITVSAVNREGEFCGVLILPGVEIGLQALANSAAALPSIAAARPQQLLGRNTEDAMSSGTVYGAACAVDGILERLSEELGGGLSAVACGESASLVLPYCRKEIRQIPTLTLDGLYALYRRNTNSSR